MNTQSAFFQTSWQTFLGEAVQSDEIIGMLRDYFEQKNAINQKLAAMAGAKGMNLAIRDQTQDSHTSPGLVSQVVSVCEANGYKVSADDVNNWFSKNNLTVSQIDYQ